MPVEKPSPVVRDKGKRGLEKSLPIMKAEDFTVALEILQTLKVIYMNWKISRQNLQSLGLMLGQQCLHTISPNPGIPSSRHNPVFSVSSPEIPGRGIWHPSQTLLLCWILPCTIGLVSFGDRTVNIKILCPFQYHRWWPGSVLEKNLAVLNERTASIRKKFSKYSQCWKISILIWFF